LPDAAYASTLPADIREGRTGVPVIDQAVRTLYTTGLLHNHARMWLASYVVHVRQVHWRAGADWLYGHLLDGDLASNHLSWQWVAGTGSSKPYLFNAQNVARFAPSPWHSPGSVIDTSYEALDHLARELRAPAPNRLAAAGLQEPTLLTQAPADLGATAPDAAAVAGRDVWLVHPWALGELPADLPADTLVIGLWVADFHRAWPWSLQRWRFVGQRMAALAALYWQGDAAAMGAALQGARSVRSIGDMHLAPWLTQWADCRNAPALFAPTERAFEAFTPWWKHSTRGMATAADLLAAVAFTPSFSVSASAPATASTLASAPAP
jgi:deoxyribodipyrimidine photo-lyase